MQDREIRLNVADMVVSLMIEPGVHVVGHVDSFLVDGPAEATVNMRFSRENRQGRRTPASCPLARISGGMPLRARMASRSWSSDLVGDILVRFASELRLRGG